MQNIMKPESVNTRINMKLNFVSIVYSYCVITNKPWTYIQLCAPKHLSLHK